MAAATALLAATGGLVGCSGRDPAPSFSYTLLDGAKASTDALRGKVVLVNFWATSCVTCVKEMPALVATHKKYQARGFETLAVAMSYDPPAYVANFAQSRQLPFGVVIDNTGAIARAFPDVRLTPTTYLIDKKGAIAKRYVGEPDFDELHALVEKLLAET
ncbi:MAG: TlpA family protein disulfide reductase [Rubrivivax sp.]|nr:TlpA family protein disulfide reductase [Rubrivivax sp.]